MKNIKNMIPTLLFILFELAFGILLISSPKQLTRTVLICFGIVLLIVGFIYLLRFFKEKKDPEKSNYLTMPFAVIAFAAAVFCVLYALLASEPQKFATIIYGCIFVVLGIYKLKDYNDDKKAGVSTSFITLISGLVSILVGIAVVVLYTMGALDSDLLLLLAGIVLIAVAVLDMLAIALAKPKKDEEAPAPDKPAIEGAPEVPAPTEKN